MTSLDIPKYTIQILKKIIADFNFRSTFHQLLLDTDDLHWVSWFKGQVLVE